MGVAGMAKHPRCALAGNKSRKTLVVYFGNLVYFCAYESSC